MVSIVPAEEFQLAPSQVHLHLAAGKEWELSPSTKVPYSVGSDPLHGTKATSQLSTTMSSMTLPPDKLVPKPAPGRLHSPQKNRQKQDYNQTPFIRVLPPHTQGNGVGTPKQRQGCNK